MKMRISQIEGWKLKAKFNGVTVVSGQETRESEYTGARALRNHHEHKGCR